MNTNSKQVVLVIDDETHILHVVSMKLTNAGYEVITAEDGEIGFDLATQQLPDLIITDLQMPYVDGLEMCLKLNKQASTQSIPILLLTARSAQIDPTLLERTNIKGIINKPFSPREILSNVKKYIAHPANEPFRAAG